MVSAEAANELMSLSDFLFWQERQPINYELLDGIPVPTVKAMAGASRRHDMVTVNMIAEFRTRLKGKPCRPSTADQSIQTFRGTRRPDVLVECDPVDDTSLLANDPRVVVEVLSPSTTRYDRFQKLEEYKLVDAISVILLVDTETPSVTVWRRASTGWSFEDLSGLKAVIELPEVGCQLPLSELYDGLTFPPPDALRPPLIS